MKTDDLEEFRNKINDLDDKIIALLGERLAICRAVGRFKAKHAIEVMQRKRINQVKTRNAELGVEAGLRPEFTRALYGLIIGEACRMEHDILAEKTTDD